MISLAKSVDEGHATIIFPVELRGKKMQILQMQVKIWMQIMHVVMLHIFHLREGS